MFELVQLVVVYRLKVWHWKIWDGCYGESFLIELKKVLEASPSEISRT